MISLNPAILYEKLEDVPEKDLMKAYVKGNEVSTWLKNKPAFGIAFNQLNIPYRVFVLARHKDLKMEDHIIINPTYHPYPMMVDNKPTNQMFDNEEGCLSYPGEKFKVRRYYKISATYYSFFDKILKNKILTGVLAVVFQHETDHLNGISCKDLHIEEPKEGTMPPTTNQTFERKTYDF
jgi:peptide deformylase